MYLALIEDRYLYDVLKSAYHIALMRPKSIQLGSYVPIPSA